MRSKFGSRPLVLLRSEQLESRHVLAAIFPAYVDGVLTLGSSGSGAPYGYENTFLLESNPTATKTIYLDFDGHHSFNNSWGHNIVFPAFDRNGNPNSFSDTELLEIQEQFQNVAEDFLPFNINVTTKDPGTAALIRSSGADQEYGVRMVATQATNGFGDGIGGVALLNSFDDPVDNPVFAFNKGSRNGGMTASHEVGHALGLRHDGLNTQEYHPGTGTGPASWGPLMGAPFGKVITQWSKGEYTGATNLEDDLSIITKAANGFTYRVDDFGNSTTAAQPLTPNNGSIFEWGIIERNTDLDYFSFETAAGDVSINIQAFQQDPNLDIEAKLYDETGAEIALSNPLLDTDASFAINLAAGTYYLSIDGVGRDGRYTDYASLGFYAISATIVDPSAIDGDFNDDGSWNVADLDLLVADIVSGGTPTTFDLNGDGNVDNLDIDRWLTDAGALNLTSGGAYLRGDANLDGFVDGQDFVAWNTNKFTSLAAWSAGDFNASGNIDGSDFVIWNTNKFQAAAAISTPGGTIAADFDTSIDAPFWPFASHDAHDHEHGDTDEEHVITTSLENAPLRPVAGEHVAIAARRAAMTNFAVRDAALAKPHTNEPLMASRHNASDTRAISRAAAKSAPQTITVDAAFESLG